MVSELDNCLYIRDRGNFLPSITLILMIRLTRGNGTYTDYEYSHPLNWLTALYNKKFDTSVISSFVYVHDKVGNRTKMTLADGDVVTYEYDEIYQLVSEVRTGNTPYSINWTYDEVGNRLTQVKDGVTTEYAYNDANQLLSETVVGVTTNYEYDANGNQIQKSDGTNTWNWTYDYENRQTNYDAPDTASDTTYVYDANGKRISKINISSLTSEHYAYDGANIVADYDGSNNLLAVYLTPFLDQNLIMVRDGQAYYYTQDGLGSVRNLVNSSTQEPVNSYDYYAFGEPLNWSENVVNRYTYTAREWDGESALYYYRARHGNPFIGRFLQRDPAGYSDSVNRYTYVMNNPVNARDPMGLFSLQLLSAFTTWLYGNESRHEAMAYDQQPFEYPAIVKGGKTIRPSLIKRGKKILGEHGYGSPDQGLGQVGRFIMATDVLQSGGAVFLIAHGQTGLIKNQLGQWVPGADFLPDPKEEEVPKIRAAGIIFFVCNADVIARKINEKYNITSVGPSSTMDVGIAFQACPPEVEREFQTLTDHLLQSSKSFSSFKKEWKKLGEKHKKKAGFYAFYDAYIDIAGAKWGVYFPQKGK